MKIWLKAKLRTWLGIDEQKTLLNSIIDQKIALYKRVCEAERVIRERTDISVDVHHKGPSQIIVTGRYRGVDYVEVFHMPDEDLGRLIAQLKDMERHAVIRRVDCAPGFRCVFNTKDKT